MTKLILAPLIKTRVVELLHDRTTCCLLCTISIINQPARRVMELATGALGSLLPKLGQLLQDEYNLQKGAKKNIEFLTRELQSIQAALRSVWAHDARELSYDMEDIVDTFLVRVQGSDPPSRKSSKKFFKKMRDIVTKAKTRHEIGQDIKERVKEVAERRDRLGSLKHKCI